MPKEFGANKGYLNVALRVLSSQGWLQYNIEKKNQVIYSVNDSTQIVADHIYIYKDVVKLIEISGQFHPRKFEEEPFRHFRERVL